MPIALLTVLPVQFPVCCLRPVKALKIVVCCSSIGNIDKKYKENAEKLFKEIFKKENDLVFGAYNNGIMGISYKIAKENNRKIIGITPKIFKEDFKTLECDVEILTENISSRTTALIENSDILLFLPGGVGTIYELMSAIESKRSQEFNKPIIIYNDEGFFDELLEMLEKTYNNNFSNIKIRNCYNVFNNYKEIVKVINNKEYICS